MSAHNHFPTVPSVDITETDLTYMIRADISGYRPEDVNVTSSQDSLIIEMQTAHEPIQSYYLGELDTEHYKRIIPLGFEISVESYYTQYSSGTLEVHVHKPPVKKGIVEKSNASEMA